MTTISQGTTRPTYPDLHHALNKALLATDATGSLLERALRFPTSVDRTRLAILADALRNAAEAIDPAGREVRHV